MKRFERWISHAGLAALVLCLALAPSTSTARAQQGKGPRAGEGQERLNAEKDWQKDREEARIFQQLRRGEQAVSPATEPILNRGAQWYAYRFTHTEYQETKPVGLGMNEIRREAFEQIIDRQRQPNANQQAFMEEFGKRFAARLGEVVKNPKRIARLNAAMTLARLAATGQEDAAEILADVVADPAEQEAVKLYAFRGLRDLFALTQLPNNPFQFKNKERETRCIAALLDYVSKPAPASPEASPGEVAALHYVRAEAVAALGQTRYPAFARPVDKKTVAIERPTALVLLKVMRRDGMPPETSLSEQVNAAVGVCRLQSRLVEQYNADYAAYHLGRFIQEFCSRSTREDQPADEKTKIRNEPWKVDAAKMVAGLTALKEDLAGPPANAANPYVSKLIDQALPLLNSMANGEGQLDVPRLAAWLDQNPPKNNAVYQGIANAVVNGPQAQ